MLDTGTNLATNTATQSGFSGFNNLMGGIGAGVGALTSIGSLWAGINNAKQSNKLAKKQYDLAKLQYDTETERYNKREQERLEANKQVADSASLYNPMTRN